MIRYLAFTLAITAAHGGDVGHSNSTQLLLTSGTYWLNMLSFNGTAFASEHTYWDPEGVPSWLVNGTDGSYWLANNENDADVRKLHYPPSKDDTSGILFPTKDWKGSTGVVHFEYNLNKTRMFGSAYGSQAIDIWNTTQPGTIALLKSIPTNDSASHPHQTVQSPCGRFAVVNDLGLDKIHVLDTAEDDDIFVSSSVSVPTGCGPRHGAFYWTADMIFPARYLVACETSHQVLVLNVTGPGILSGTPLQTLDTALNTDVPAAANVTAAELLLYTNLDRSADVYISNRLTGNATDTIAHFRLAAPADRASVQPRDLTAADVVSTGGVGPRGMNLSPDGTFLFVGNQQAGPAGLVALRRDVGGGGLAATPVASMRYEGLAGADAGYGPQFVMPWGNGWASASASASASGSALAPTSRSVGRRC